MAKIHPKAAFEDAARADNTGLIVIVRRNPHGDA
jgi:hypothetical protein